MDNVRRLKLDNLNWYPEQVIPKGFPVLDLQNMSLKDQRDCFTKAAEGAHCVYIKNHNIGNKDIEEIINITRILFRESETIKSKYVEKQPGLARGYSGFNKQSSSAVFDIDADKHKGDTYQCFSWGINKNLYPNVDFKTTWENYYHKCFLLSKTIFELLLDNLEMRDVLNWQHVQQGEHLLKVYDYPAEQSDQDFRLVAHGDTSFLTLLYQTPADNGFISLEVEVDGQFVKVPAVNGTLLLNFGEPMLSLSKGRLKPAIHRVVNPKDNFEGSARFSIPLLFGR